MPTSICKKCKEKPANRAGTLCLRCWKAEQGKRPEPLTDDEETMLAAMQWVSKRPEAEDRTFQQREMRKWLRQDRKGFMGHRASLEGKALSAKSTTTPVATPGSASSGSADPARERVGEMLKKEFEVAKFARDNRQAIVEYMADREDFLAWKAERAAASAGAS
jgi:hypothetical protein